MGDGGKDAVVGGESGVYVEFQTLVLVRCLGRFT
jgi:hypothetical protein